MVLYVWKFTRSVFGGSFSVEAVIDNAASVIWVQRFAKAGEFELYIAATPELLRLFSGDVLDVQNYPMPTGDVFITRQSDPETAMLVEKTRLETNAEDGDYLVVTGRSAEAILSRRVIPKQTYFTGTAENCIRAFIAQNVTEPTDQTRRIDIVSLGDASGYEDTIEKQATGKNLLAVIEDICAAYQYGFRFVFDGSKFTFQLYKGTDHSAGQNENIPVIFSPEYDNLGNTEYARDRSGYYNAAYVGGEGEGSARIIHGLQDHIAATGYDRRELWVDARSTSSDTDGGELTPAQYRQLLAQQGMEELRGSNVTTTFSGDVIDTGLYVFGKDYGLGDRVSVTNEYGITATAIVAEITEVEDESGRRLYPTLEEWSV